VHSKPPLLAFSCRSQGYWQERVLVQTIVVIPAIVICDGSPPCIIFTALTKHDLRTTRT
jgi:hypothetical protein